MMPTEDKFASGLAHWGDYIFGFLLIIIGLIALVGNGLAVNVFWRKGSEITVPEVLLLNIAIVDLLLAGATYPAPIVAAFSHRWIFGEIGCTIYGFVGFFLGLSTIFSLMILAVFRFLKSNHSHSVQWLTASSAQIYLIPPIYINSLIWSLIPFFGWSGYDVEPFGLSCTLAWKDPNYGDKIYIISVVAFCFVLPGIAIVSSYASILHQIRRTGRMFSDRATSAKQSNQAETQLIQVTFSVCVGFLLAWSPYAVLSIWTSFGDPSAIPIWITPISVILAKSSVAYNPIIYVLMTRRYRVDFTRALRELLRLTGPAVENVDVRRPLKTAECTVNTNMPQNRSAIGNESNDEEIKGEDKIMVEACCSQPPEEAADSNEVILSVVVHSDDRIG